MSYPQFDEDDCPCCGKYGSKRIFVCEEAMKSIMEHLKASGKFKLCDDCSFVNEFVEELCCGCGRKSMLCPNCTDKRRCQDCGEVACLEHLENQICKWCVEN